MIFSPGYKIGAYTIVRPLGQGGMGDVYEVVHEQLGTHYALKAFACDCEETEVLQKKFFEEGRLLSKLTHPRIVRVFDLAVEPKSQMPYFVMDLVLYEDGESHTVEDVEKSDITEDLVYLWFKDVAEALDYIHSQGVVHRDIKPSNLLLNPDYHVTLTDFGVSRIFGEKIVHEVDASRTMASKTGRGKLVLGTEHYIAPEVAQGEEATPAADAYALGMMCFRLLTGVWYEPDSDALSLLSKYKLRWMAVLPQLLSPHAEKRPKELYRLKEHLKGSTQTPANVQPKNKSKLRKKFDVVRFGMMTFFAVAFVAGASWFGYQGFMKYDADRKSEAERMNAELKRQIAEQKEASQKLATEQRRLRDEATRQKAEAEKIAEATVTTQIVTQIVRTDGHGSVAGHDAPVAAEQVATSKSNKPKAAPPVKEKMEIVGKVEEHVDYGPIPQVKYKWFTGDNALIPNKVVFALANKSTIDLVPMRKGSFLLLNPPNQGKVYHRVTLTRPYWLSKYCVTVENLKDITPDGFGEYDKLGVALQGKYPLYLRRSRQEIENYCKHLTAKYRSLLPDGYVFRLPTEAELCFAINEDKARSLYGTDWFSKVDTEANRDGVLPSFAKVIKGLGLESFGKWCWGSKLYTGNDCLMVGGVTDPLPSGVCDLVGGPLWTIEKMDPETLYFDDEQDPIRFDTAPDARCLAINKSERVFSRETDRFNFHVVLAPVLTEDHAIIASQSAEVVVPKAKPRKYAWRTPNKLSHPLETKFKLDRGGEMVFCYCPRGKFEMSDVQGRGGSKHRVEVTRPFWMTKYCVTAKQWREFGAFDCEWEVREVERQFPQSPVCVRFNRWCWNAYCEFLTEKYRDSLPPGYVFRLPTEAEYEYVYADSGICESSSQLEFERILRKNPKLTSLGDWVIAGVLVCGGRRVLVGGRGRMSPWGLFDFWHNFAAEQHVLDVVEHIEEDYVKVVQESLSYASREVDPVRWSPCANLGIVRLGPIERWGCGFGLKTFAHIAIGPDILAPLKDTEKQPYPQSDFGGRRISDQCTIGGFSSLANGWKDVERHKKLLTPEPLAKGVDTRAFHTERETKPWVQIDLPDKIQVVGLVVEARGDARGHGWNRSVPLVVWVSDDGKTWHEAARDEQILHRYRFDLSKKMVKGKYLRIGRDSKTNRTDWFHLNKVIIYGK